MKLVGRRAECGMLDRLAEAVCAGQSRALVLCGDPGVGKTALLEHLVREATDCKVVQIAGVESEMELAFAGLHQLCAPLLAGLDDLPDPQAEPSATPKTPHLVSGLTVGLHCGLADANAPLRGRRFPYRCHQAQPSGHLEGDRRMFGYLLALSPIQQTLRAVGVEPALTAAGDCHNRGRGRDD